jgi:hypothetical protein
MKQGSSLGSPGIMRFVEECEVLANHWLRALNPRGYSALGVVAGRLRLTAVAGSVDWLGTVRQTP